MSDRGDTRPLVIGVGNLWRGDDAAGILAVRELIAREGSWLDGIESAGDVTQILEAFRGRARIAIVDAQSGGGQGLGEVRVFDSQTLELKAADRLASSHILSIAQCIELARALGVLPLWCRIYAIEGQNFGMGAAITEKVQAGVKRLVQRVAADLR